MRRWRKPFLELGAAALVIGVWVELQNYMAEPAAPVAAFDPYARYSPITPPRSIREECAQEARQYLAWRDDAAGSAWMHACVEAKQR